MEDKGTETEKWAATISHVRCTGSVSMKLVTMYSNYLGNIFQGDKSISKGLGEIA